MLSFPYTTDSLVPSPSSSAYLQTSPCTTFAYPRAVSYRAPICQTRKSPVICCYSIFNLYSCCPSAVSICADERTNSGLACLPTRPTTRAFSVGIVGISAGKLSYVKASQQSSFVNPLNAFRVDWVKRLQYLWQVYLRTRGVGCRNATGDEIWIERRCDSPVDNGINKLNFWIAGDAVCFGTLFLKYHFINTRTYSPILFADLVSHSLHSCALFQNNSYLQPQFIRWTDIHCDQH